MSLKKIKLKKIFPYMLAYKKYIPWILILILLGLTVFSLYWATSVGQTPYDYFIKLADSFLHGKYYLDTNEPWLNELIPITGGKFAVVYPPAPAIISIPFVAIFSPNFHQEILSSLMGALAAFIWGLIAYQKSKNRLTSIWVFLLAAFGNIVWYMSTNGSVWYLGQVSAYLFLTLTIYEAINKKRIGLIAFYFGFAVLSRLQVVLAFPLVFYLIRNQLKNWKNILIFISIAGVFGILYGFYNYLRFGSFIETGYGLIPGVLNEPWYQKGIFDISYIPDHIKVMFTSFPIFSKDVPFIKPSWGGLAIWITSPVFIYAFWNNLKELKVLTAWLSIILISLIIMSHGTTGFTQFGYRFAVDFYPLILFLIVNSVSKTGLKWHHWFLLFLSIVVNTWGVVWINKFGWVSF
jgi:hypothetical protein